MISGIPVEVDGRTETLRLTTRAMMAIEERLGPELAAPGAPPLGFAEIAESLERSPRIRTIMVMVAECADDGRGVEMAQAQALIDELGIEPGLGALVRAIEAAFPVAKGGAGSAGPEGAGKNRKRAARTG